MSANKLDSSGFTTRQMQRINNSNNSFAVRAGLMVLEIRVNMMGTVVVKVIFYINNGTFNAAFFNCCRERPFVHCDETDLSKLIKLGVYSIRAVI